jgi:hypothetical protein
VRDASSRLVVTFVAYPTDGTNLIASGASVNEGPSPSYGHAKMLSNSRAQGYSVDNRNSGNNMNRPQNSVNVTHGMNLWDEDIPGHQDLWNSLRDFTVP